MLRAPSYVCIVLNHRLDQEGSESHRTLNSTPQHNGCSDGARARGAIMIEEFFKAHQYTIAAIAAAGTVGAVPGPPRRDRGWKVLHTFSPRSFRIVTLTVVRLALCVES